MPKKNKQFVVIGLGRFGNSVATTLYSMGHDVLAIDKDLELVEDIAEQVTHAVRLDATDEAAFKAIGLRNFDVAIVCIGGDIQASILVTMLCKEQGVPFVLAKAMGELHAKVLARVGADKVIFPERDMGVRVAHNLVTTNILEYIELSQDYSLVEIEVPKAWNDQTMRELNLRVRHGINVVAIRHTDGGITVSPMGSDALSAGDVLIAVGSVEAINKLDDLSVRG